MTRNKQNIAPIEGLDCMDYDGKISGDWLGYDLVVCGEPKSLKRNWDSKENMRKLEAERLNESIDWIATNLDWAQEDLGEGFPYQKALDIAKETGRRIGVFK
jgi:hypothetical protein